MGKRVRSSRISNLDRMSFTWEDNKKAFPDTQALKTIYHPCILGKKKKPLKNDFIQGKIESVITKDSLVIVTQFRLQRGLWYVFR